MKKYIVELSADERELLREMVAKGKAAAYKIRHANILLLADVSESGPAWKDEDIAAAIGCHVTTVENVRKRLVLEGFDAAIDRKREDVGRPPMLDGDAEAKLTMLACSESPEGRERWTLQLLADRMVVLGVVDTCSRMTVQRALKKTA